MVALGERGKRVLNAYAKGFNEQQAQQSQLEADSKQMEIYEVINDLKTQIPYLQRAISDMNSNRIPEAHGKVSGVISVLNDIIRKHG